MFIALIFIDIYYHSDNHIREIATHQALLCQLASKIVQHNFGKSCKPKAMFLFKVSWGPFISHQRLIFCCKKKSNLNLSIEKSHLTKRTRCVAVSLVFITLQYDKFSSNQGCQRCFMPVWIVIHF